MATEANFIRVTSLIMVMAGALLLALSLPPALKMSREMSGRPAKNWRLIIYLMAFFLMGYILFDIVLFFSLPIPGELVTGVVFLGGAVFVFLIIRICGNTLSAQHETEEALRRSESCFHVIFDSINDAIIIQDPESGEILGVNDKMCAMFGCSHEEASRFSIGELITDVPGRDAREWMEKGSPKGIRYFECLVRNRGGDHFWVEVNIQNALIDGQNRRLLTMRDIDKRKHSEERLARLNECLLGFAADHDENIKRLTSLCGEMMGGACALYNKLDSGLLRTQAHWNAPSDFKMSDKADGHLCTDVIMQGGDRLIFVRNLGDSSYAETDPNVRQYDLHTYMGMPVKCKEAYVGSLCVVFQKDFTPDEEDGRFMGILSSAIGVEEERRLAAEALRSVHAELESRVLERTDELARANEQLLNDIAERKKAEEALWKSETILRKVFESIPDMLAVIDRDLRILHSNWQGGYEYVPEDIRNGSPHCYDAYYPGQGRPCDDCHAMEVFRTGRPVSKEKINPRIGLMEVRAFPIYDDSGEVVMVVEYLRNITERKRLEDELRRAHKLESLGVLAGGIAHDFNNLLTGILGNISLAKIVTDQNSKTFKRLDDAEKAVWRARDLTQQLMTFSKGGAPVKKAAAIEQIVRDSASFVLRGSNVRCEFKVPEDLWPVEVDEGQMNQVINNLIINADQSMAEGGIIEVSIENMTVGPQNEMSLKAGPYVKISIRDHGAGIPEEHIHRIFDPYFTTKQKGSGLGLATVYSIIKNHDGYVGVESMLGEGATFRVYIPSSENGLPEIGERRKNASGGAGRILVMDDEDIIREVAAEILGHLGYNAVTCCDGHEALDLYRQSVAAGEPFTAVIMDLTIPGGMGGKETMKRLREMNKEVVGIVSSGYCNDPILASYRDYGFSGIVEKPYSLDELGTVLHTLLSGGETS